MAHREEGAAVPNWRQGQEQPHHQDAVRQRHIHLNWSNFKPEFSGKLEEDAEAHLLRSNDWMEAHCFEENIRVQRFCLTLLGEARLWYQSLEPLENTTWAQLQNLFRQRYSKLGNTCEQLFHAWRSFTFDGNTETIDSYVIRIRQVATLLGYGEPQILEVFKNTLPTKLLLCNPNFLHKNNRYFGLSSIYFLYPLASLLKMVKQEMPASIEQSKLFVLVTRCWSSFVFWDQ